MQDDADLLALVCRRLAALDEPACIKDSELRYVSVNEAYARLFREKPQAFQGHTDNELSSLLGSGERDEMERRAVVFSEDGSTDLDLPDGGIWRIEVEQFVTDSGEVYIYERFVARPQAMEPRFQPANDARASVGRFASVGRSAEVWLPDDALKGENPGHAFAPDTTNAGFNALLADALSNLDAGVLILDRDDRVVFVNDTMQQIYETFMGSIRLGEPLIEVLRRGAQNCLSGDLDGMSDEQRENWVQERAKAYWIPFFEQVAETGDGRWMKIINRRLPNGYMIGLRLDVTEVKEREFVLVRQRKEVDLYKAILDALPVPVFARDEHHLMTYSNEAGFRLYGKPAEAVIGQNEVAVFGVGAGPFYEENEEILNTGKVSIAERLIPEPGGSSTPVLSRISRAELPDGKRYVIGSLMDISVLKQREHEREEAHQAAEKAKGDLLEILNNAEYGVMVIRQDDLTVELANEVIIAQWKATSLKEIVGRSFIELLDYNYARQCFQLTEEQHIRAKEVWRQELKAGRVPLREVKTAEGASLIIHGRPISGNRVLLTYSDITEIRHRDEQISAEKTRLAEKGQLINDALEAIDQGLLLLKYDRVADCNAAVVRLMDLPADIVKPGADWTYAFAYCAKRGDFGAEPLKTLQSLKERSAAGEPVEMEFQVGGKRWIRLEARPGRDHTFVVLLTDITERLKRQKELETLLVRAEKADKAKSDFLANVSHSIRTPMNGVLGMAELLARSPLDTRQKAFVEAIAKSGKALLTIIGDILDFSQIDSDQVELQPGNFDPLTSVDDMVGLVASKAEEKDIDVIVRHDADFPFKVRGDALRFRQIVFNLLRNAIKFTERGHVEITLRNAEPINGQSAITLTVQDTGIGIPRERLHTIFEKFSRVDGSSQRRNEGMGLGLAIAAGVARIMGGRIEVESEEGRGSMFTVTLPIERVENRSRPLSTQGQLPGGRILVIEPGQASRAALVDMLDGWGFETDAVEDDSQGLAALEAAHAVHASFSLAIINNRLPDHNAVELIRALRKDDRFRDLPVILLTKSDPSEMESFGNAEVQAHIAKPVRSSLLFSTVSDLIRARPRASAIATRRAHVVSPPHLQAARDTLELLIAEDNEINILMYEQILSGTSYRYKIVRDGQQALETWRRERPKAILMDVNMPVMDGFEATAAIRAEEVAQDIPRVPVIAVTSHADESSRLACLDAGMDDYLAKPLSPDRLIDKVATWVEIARHDNDEVRSAAQSG